MADWTVYKGIDIPDTASGPAGINLTNDLKDLADRAPFLSSSDPTASDDETDGFSIGSHWLNTSTLTTWVCMGATTGAAKWRSLWRRVEHAVVLMPGGPVTDSDSRALLFDYDVAHAARGTNAVDLQRVRSADSQVASGNQSAILGGENNKAFATDSAVIGGKGNNAGGSEGAISNVQSNTPNPVTVTSTGHGLQTGQIVNISGTTTTPSITGDRAITVTGASTFTVPVNVTSVTGSTGTWTTKTTAIYAVVAGGEGNKALGKSSLAEGSHNTAIGLASHAEGLNTLASGSHAHAEGSGTTASGDGSHAEGGSGSATSYFAHAEGYGALASGTSSHAEGRYAVASGYAAHAEGADASATGYYSHAEGGTTAANGSMSHAEGSLTIAQSQFGHAGGCLSKSHLRAQWARAAGGHSSQRGTAQTTITHLFIRTTGTTAQAVTLDGAAAGSSNQLKVLSGQTLSCFINVVGRQDGGGGAHAAFLHHVCVRNDGGTTEIVDSVQLSALNPSTWGGISFSRDQTNDLLEIKVQGNTSSAINIRWMATVLSSEVADAAI